MNILSQFFGLCENCLFEVLNSDTRYSDFTTRIVKISNNFNSKIWILYCIIFNGYSPIMIEIT